MAVLFSMPMAALKSGASLAEPVSREQGPLPREAGLALTMEQEHDTLRHLFQQEFSRMVAVISKRFGLDHMETAEDIVSETFLLATETWGIKGMPPNPTAWLYAVARQKTLYHFRRSRIFETKVIPELASHQEGSDDPGDLDFSQQNIKDSQLQMLFAICAPSIASEAQIGLALRILCGFGIDEIAEALLSNKDAINKRLFRAKTRLRTDGLTMDLPSDSEMVRRLDNVLHILYLLFNEGYYSRTDNQILRKDLCLEALRLALILADYEKTNRPKTHALIALMCFHASRFDARQANDPGMPGLVLYEEQNEGLWDKELIHRGMHFLDRSASGNEISSYHLEARIAYWHCMKEDSREKWEDILRLYDQLLLVNYSPGVLLNRIFALYKVHGPHAALKEAENLRLENSHFYFLLLGELYKTVDRDKARFNLQKAHSLAKTRTEREGIQKKIDSL